MKIITFATLKGGAGKTMNAFNIAGILAEQYKVLLIDVDPQCNLSDNCGIDDSDPSMLTVREVFENRVKAQPTLRDVVFESPIEELPNLDVIPSSIMLFMAERQLISRDKREEILAGYIKRNQDEFEKYDYVIIDTNPSMGIININSFYAADSIILTSDISKNSIKGAELFCALWDEIREEMEKEDNIKALIICNVNKRTVIARDMLEYVKDASFSKDIVYFPYVPSTVRLKDTEVFHKPVNILYPSEPICAIYRELVDALIKGGSI